MIMVYLPVQTRLTRMRSYNDATAHALPVSPLIAALLRQHFHGLLDREGAWPLPRWKLLEGRQMLGNDRLRGNKDIRVLDEPSHVIACLVFRAFERVGPQIEQLGRA